MIYKQGDLVYYDGPDIYNNCHITDIIYIKKINGSRICYIEHRGIRLIIDGRYIKGIAKNIGFADGI